MKNYELHLVSRYNDLLVDYFETKEEAALMGDQLVASGKREGHEWIYWVTPVWA